MSKKVYAIYFSPTGNTEKITLQVAGTLAEKLDRELEIIDITLPETREKDYIFTKEDIVVVGAPTYAGKLPNKILPTFHNCIKGEQTIGIGIVTYGNRNFDDSLAELSHVLESNGFLVIGGAAIVGEHPFSKKLGSNRPCKEDLSEGETWAKEISDYILAMEDNADETMKKLSIPGDAEAAYYVPKQENGEPAVFLKAKPKTDTEKCQNCGICAESCPMGSIEKENPSVVSGLCIKCHSCVKKCPEGAKFFDDEMFLSHVRMLEVNFRDEKRNLYFI